MNEKIKIGTLKANRLIETGDSVFCGDIDFDRAMYKVIVKGSGKTTELRARLTAYEVSVIKALCELCDEENGEGEPKLSIVKYGSNQQN